MNHSTSHLSHPTLSPELICQKKAQWTLQMDWDEGKGQWIQGSTQSPLPSLATWKPLVGFEGDRGPPLLSRCWRGELHEERSDFWCRVWRWGDWSLGPLRSLVYALESQSLALWPALSSPSPSSGLVFVSSTCSPVVVFFALFHTRFFPHHHFFFLWLAYILDCWWTRGFTFNKQAFKLCYFFGPDKICPPPDQRAEIENTGAKAGLCTASDPWTWANLKTEVNGKQHPWKPGLLMFFMWRTSPRCCCFITLLSLLSMALQRTSVVC